MFFNRKFNIFFILIMIEIFFSFLCSASVLNHLNFINFSFDEKKETLKKIKLTKTKKKKKKKKKNSICLENMKNNVLPMKAFAKDGKGREKHNFQFNKKDARRSCSQIDVDVGKKRKKKN